VKRHKYLSSVICIYFLTALFLFGLIRNVRGEVKDLETTVQWKASQSQYFSEEKEYRQKAKEKYDELSKGIYELEVKAEKADSKTKADVKNKMNELREKRAVVYINMEKLDAVSGDKWKAAKQKVDSEMDDLEKAYRKARSLLK
jgi:hypothetical protein